MKNANFYQQKWTEIHTHGAQVVRGELSHYNFCRWIRTVPDELPCSKCRKHAREYLENYPPENEPNSFRWGWQFHNTVNERKKKPIMDYATAAALYSV